MNQKKIENNINNRSTGKNRKKNYNLFNLKREKKEIPSL
jgi:hypothetical protein